MYAVTGASGQLGTLVINELLKTVPPSEIVALARSPEKLKALAERGVHVRQADYSRPETLPSALAGVERLLLISSSELGQRAEQHRAVIRAAGAAGVELLVYTSLLHADHSILGLGDEHRQTEAMIRESGLPFVLLRNGWYTENYTMQIAQALESGVMYGASGNGQVASATRADYAAAAATVLLEDPHSGAIYELAGDQAWTLDEFVDEVARQSGKPLKYVNLSRADYKAGLLAAGLPEPFAELFADSSEGVAKGALFDGSHLLSKLIGRPTTSLGDAIKAALGG